MLSQPPPAVPVINTRNPYFWAIDEQGNQLPYVDELRFLLFDQEVLNLKALAGEVGYSNNIGLALYPELKKAEQEGKIKLILNTGADVNTNTIQFNLNHDDPVMREIFQDARFRHAISFEREVINEVIWLGLLEPAQVGPEANSEAEGEQPHELMMEAIEYYAQGAVLHGSGRAATLVQEGTRYCCRQPVDDRHSGAPDRGNGDAPQPGELPRHPGGVGHG